MKRVAIAAVLVVAMVFGVIAYATAANPETVTVSAKINPNIAMTIAGTNHDWTGGLDLDVADVSGSSVISVRSNAVWDLTMVPTIAPELSGVITDSYDSYAPNTNIPDPLDGTDIKTGFTDITATYTLDLTDNEAAYLLDPAATYTAKYVYTAAQ